MMKIFKISALCAFALFMAFGCQKTVDVTPVFVEKTFFPTDEADAVSRVKTFLAAVEASKTGERTTFSDMEVNEGRWTLEGSGNYNYNVNLQQDNVVFSKSYTCEINNIVDTEIKMVGSSMTSNFSNLMASIASDEQAMNLVASGMDVKIESVSNIKTNIKVSVLFSGQTNSSAMNFEETAIEMTIELNNSITPPQNNSCYTWTPDMMVYEDLNVIHTDDLRCYNNNCLTDVLDTNPNPNYPLANYGTDLGIASSIANQFISNLNQSTPPNVNYALSDVIIYNKHLPPDAAGKTLSYLYVAVIFAYGSTSYCY